MKLERRKNHRFKEVGTVMIENLDDKNLCYAKMFDFSGDGMYCQTDYEIRPGTSVSIILQSQPFKFAPKKYFGKITRCEKLRKIEDIEELYNYGIAVKIFKGV